MFPTWITYILDHAVRTFLIAWIATLWVLGVDRWLRSGKGPTIQRLVPCLLPLLIPPVAVGYVYAGWSLFLVHRPMLNQTFYAFLVLLRCVPVGILVSRLIPAFDVRQSEYCLQLAGENGRVRHCLALVHRFLGWRYRLFPVFAVLFLLAMNEFEIASLLNAGQWTVTLFDAHARGLELEESIRLALFPMLLETVLAAAVMFMLLRRTGPGSVGENRDRSPASAGPLLLYYLYMVMGWSMLVLIPVGHLLLTGFGAWRLFRFDAWMARETMVSALVAGTVLACVAGLIRMLTSLNGHRQRAAGRVVMIVLISIGLISALPLSLAVLGIFRIPVLSMVARTPVPWVVALVLQAFPPALLLRLALPSPAADSAGWLLSMTASLPGRGQEVGLLLWRYCRRPLVWIGFWIFLQAFLDLTAAGILSPPGMTAVVPRLYNLMHYGQSGKLSATVLLIVIAPVGLFLLVSTVIRCALQIIYQPSRRSV